MPAISKIRFANVVYEGGEKRYNDELFLFDGHNAAVVLENGGGKTVFIHTALQAIMPHTNLADRKIRNTLALANNTAHVAIEWILQDQPRRYGLTAVSLYLDNGRLASHKYTYHYPAGDQNSIENLPFSVADAKNRQRPAGSGEINDYYLTMAHNHMNAQVFPTIDKYSAYLEENFKIVTHEWQSLAKINSSEGDAEAFFENCRTTADLVNKLLIPTVQKGMSGNGVEDFVKLFEEKRNHFRKYKQLKDQIEENKLVEQEINRMMKSFEMLAQTEQEANVLKRRIKSVYEFAVGERTAAKAESEASRSQREQLASEEQAALEHKKRLEISRLKQELDCVMAEVEGQRQQFDTVERSREEAALQQETLRFLRDRRELEKKQADLQNEQIKLQSLEENPAAGELEEELSKVRQGLRAVYDAREAYLNREISQIRRQIDNEKAELTELEKQISKAGLDKGDILQQKAAAEATIIRLEKDLQEISAKILLNPKEHKVPEKLGEWRKELVESQEIHTKLAEQEYLLTDERTAIWEQLAGLRGNEKELAARENTVKHYIEENLRKEQPLAEKLRQFALLRGLESVYQDTGKIDAVLELELEKRNKELQEAALTERIALRLQDTYGNSDAFAADPQMLEFIAHSDKPVESGADYALRLMCDKNLTRDELFQVFPFWQMSLIVQEGDKDYVLSRLNAWADRITVPLLVMTNNEARNLEDGNFKLKSVLPKFWPEVIRAVDFVTWKDNIREQAENVSLVRAERERAYQDVDRLHQDYGRFLEEYPKEKLDQNTAEAQRLKFELERTRLDIAAAEANISNINTRLGQTHKQKEQLKLLIDDLERKIERGHEWLQKEQEKAGLQITVEKLDQELQLVDQAIRRLEFKTNVLKKTIEELAAEGDQNQQALYQLCGEELYMELRDFDPIDQGRPEAALKNERKRLLDALNKVNYERESLQDNIKRLNQEVREYTERLKNYDVNQEMEDEFPPNGEVLLNQLAQRIKNLTGDSKAEAQRLKEIESKKDRLAGVYEKAFGEYIDQYQIQPVIIPAGLEELEGDLAAELKRIAENKHRLQQSTVRLEKLLAELDEVLMELNGQKGRYDYLAEELGLVSISETDQMNFPYNRRNITFGLLEDMEVLHQKVLGRKEEVRRERNLFEQFCQSSIKNEKMRQTALNGIRSRDNYQDMQEWVGLMKSTISRAIEIAEEHLREHNEDVIHFINQLHVHLKTICTEMSGIEKMTRVKVEETYRSIYAITVPVWDENEARQKLLHHIEWMTEHLNGAEYKNEDGSENSGKVKQDLEKWLHPRQLLARVTNVPFKVQLRKVSNDNRISNALTDWTTSNSWSGGEKWSKNMALFLGIQSYLAEKRQHVGRKHTNSRTVILDNPFGKASSDHVLEPVFFIAEKLGFQVIALTAHAEGKFLRDYFPIIYSCRLRESTDGDTRIVTKEKLIRQAYFKDAHPESMERLGELKQVELF